MGDALMQVLDIAEKIQADAPETPDASSRPHADPTARRTRPPPAPRHCRSDQPSRPAARRRDPPVRRRQLGRRDRAARRGGAGRDARRADLHDRARDPGRDRPGPRRVRPDADPRCPAGHRDARADRRDHRRDVVRRADRRGPEVRLRQPPVARRLHRGDARKSPSRSSPPGSCSSSSVPACPRSGSAGCRSPTDPRRHSSGD